MRIVTLVFRCKWSMSLCSFIFVKCFLPGTVKVFNVKFKNRWGCWIGSVCFDTLQWYRPTSNLHSRSEWISVYMSYQSYENEYTLHYTIPSVPTLASSSLNILEKQTAAKRIIQSPVYLSEPLTEPQLYLLFFFSQELHKYKENEKDTEVLMSALSAMQDKTQHLENSLSAETRIKLDLFSALGDAKRQLEIAQGQPDCLKQHLFITLCEHTYRCLWFWTIFSKPSCVWTDMFTGQILQKDQEIKDLKQKIAEVMAVMPSISYTADTSSMTPVAPHYSSKFMDTNSSGLDPNASVYQPLKKWKLRLASRLLPSSHHFFFLQALHLPICSACLQLRTLFLLGFYFPPRQVRRMLYCVTVFVVVKTKDKKNLKTDITCRLGSPRFFFLWSV